MSEAFKRTGILYGRLGLNTPAATIEARYPGIETAAKALTLEQLPELLLVMYGRTTGIDTVGFLDHFRTDPTFDVRFTDREAALLATAIADYAMTEGLELGGEMALAIVTASVGGMRQPSVSSEILSIADEALVPTRRIRRSRPAGARSSLSHRRSRTPWRRSRPSSLYTTTSRK